MIQEAFPDLAPSLDERFSTFPSTRYQGSKRKLLSFLYAACRNYEFSDVLDLYSGTSSVSLMFRSMGKSVTANDYLLYNWTTANVLLTSTNEWLNSLNLPSMIERALAPNSCAGTLVRDNFKGIYFLESENEQIDWFCANLEAFPQAEADLLIYLMGQAMLMKRPYNLFHRANLDMRTKDVPRSFGNAKTWETSFQRHMIGLASKLRVCKFDGPQGKSVCLNTGDLSGFDVNPDLIYLDPPYLNRRQIPVDYSTFYHFLDGLVRYDLFGRGNEKYPHKPINLMPSRWRNAAGGLEEVRAVFDRWPRAIVAISYRGDGKPSVQDLKDAFQSAGYRVIEHTAVEYKYALSKQFDATEELIIGIPGGDLKEFRKVGVS